MLILILLITISILVAGGFLVLFIWAVKSGQYDDTDSPSIRMLLDKKSKADDKNHTLP